MKRLTNVQGICHKCIGCIEESNCQQECDAIEKCTMKLKEYEDLEERGLLLKLPCKVGDYVYDRYLNRRTVISINIEKDICIHTARDTSNTIWTGAEYTPEDFGKIVFLTKEEAEKDKR